MASTTYTGVNHGLQVGNNQGPIEARFYTQTQTNEDIDRIWLHNLRCPDSLAVKNRLKETKDKLVLQSFQWMLHNPEYLNWRDGKDVCLLWIKGGAGKGKTMMSIGLIEELSRTRDESTVVAYSFCQNADNALNTLESIIKGLILQLISRQPGLKESLRSRWDTSHNRFTEDMNSWINLWNVLMDMLDRCNCSKIFLIVDALDECQDNGMADFFKRLVRNGLDRQAKIKWLLTSRPLDNAERALFVSDEKVQVSLDLNSKYVSQAVEAYISHKVDELSHLYRYKKPLRTELEAELSLKAEGTFLWVSLVCKTLESVSQDEVLTTLRNLPPGLHPFYDRILTQLREGEPDDVSRCMRLLKAMMLAYRPLKIEEIQSVTGLTNEEDAIQMLVGRCASLIRMQEQNIEFVHQSARDYLTTKNAQSILDSYEYLGHNDIVQGCLSFLSGSLKMNLVDLPRPDSTKESFDLQDDKEKKSQLSCLDYAATFWVQHLQHVESRTVAHSGFSDGGSVSGFLRNKMLEWLECLSLLDRLPLGIKALNILFNLTKDGHPLVSALVQDTTRFLLRHYYTINNWPSQIYSSAIIFSPELSIVKRENSDKIPGYLKRVPLMEDTWASLLQTLEGHSSSVTTVAFSPDGTQIASGSYDKTIKLWDTTTGDLRKTLEGHWGSVDTVAFSPDGTQIASGSRDNTIKLWDTTTGDLRKTLEGHSSSVTTVAFSPDGTQIASGSDDNTIKLWDTTTGDLRKTLEGHSSWVYTVAFSPDGTQIASGSRDTTIKLWDTTTGDLRKTLEGHSSTVWAVAFSPDGTQIASGSLDNTIKLWDTTTGDLRKTLEGHSSTVWAVAFSPDGTQIASGSSDNTIKLWDTTTGDLRKTLEGHSSSVNTVAFSPDGTQIASGSDDTTIKLWDTTTGDLRKTLEGHSSTVWAVAFSPDGTQIASGSLDNTIKLWDTTTGDLWKTLEGHSSWVYTVAFSPDGTQIASGSDDNTIKLWDTTTGDLRKTLEGHSSWVYTVAFSPDGTQIASGSRDTTIKLWDTTTGDLRKTLEGHWNSVRAVALSLDYTQIASDSGHQITKLTDIPKSLKNSKSLRTVFRGLFKLKSSKKVSKPEITSIDYRYLPTSSGSALKGEIATDKLEGNPSFLYSLSVQEQWICFEGMPFLRLSSEFQPSSFDVRGGHIAIGFRNGQVLRFEIDQHMLARLNWYLRKSDSGFNQSD
ncbi:G-protein beta WD- 40 repeats containing protein [Penicillium taxi]|uniref:G-protein beta WD- 40 repeats containing protein n=1 Tax=Penicillium taxi TaxID=168475 RepID=UPI0025450D67|nr:G-protein beta WD- 40 repeats containing protein [Penicillium taxi]KAJ5901856.1 G-protein beta WD- 40 repeats containing protein [Penicillium taxi]